MSQLIKIIIVLTTLSLTGCATAQKGAMLGAYSDIRKAKFQEALGELSAAENYIKPSPALQAEIAFLKGQCYEGLNKIPEAIGSYKYLVAIFPESIYAYQAKERLQALEAK
jgi:outer membrane protein assembly factor BamD (BamD/ComL family)